LIARQLAMLRLIESAPQQALANLRAWKEAFQRDGKAISHAALAFKARMHGPQLVS
jgi:hypothetical protein